MYELYDGPMRAFLKRNFPTLEADDLVQETMAALARRLPDYRYVPDEKGHFHNYLLGVLKHKAMDALSCRTREAAARDGLRRLPAARGDDEATWRADALEVALGQMLSDERINPLHRTVFRHVALMHERPEDVAAQFGLTRANVDQVKRRLIGVLADLVKRLTDAS